MRHNGKPAAADPFSLSYVVPHLGEIEVLSGKLDTRGRCELPGVRADASGTEFFFTMGDQLRQRLTDRFLPRPTERLGRGLVPLEYPTPRVGRGVGVDGGIEYLEAEVIQ